MTPSRDYIDVDALDRDEKTLVNDASGHDEDEIQFMGTGRDKSKAMRRKTVPAKKEAEVIEIEDEELELSRHYSAMPSRNKKTSVNVHGHEKSSTRPGSLASAKTPSRSKNVNEDSQNSPKGESSTPSSSSKNHVQSTLQYQSGANVSERKGSNNKRPASSWSSQDTPTKRLHQSALPSTSNSASSIRPPKRKHPIDLTGDSDDESRLSTSSRKKPKRLLPGQDASSLDCQGPSKESHGPQYPPTDSEDEYDNWHAALDQRQNSNWRQQVPTCEDEDISDQGGDDDIDFTDMFKDLDISTNSAYVTPRRAHIPVFYPPRPPKPLDPGQCLDPEYRPKRKTPTLLRIDGLPPSWKNAHRRIGYLIGEFMGMKRLSLSQSHRYAPGSINRVVQANGLVVACSAVRGGEADRPNEKPPDPIYNREGSLVVWRDGKVHKLHAHQRRYELSPADIGASDRVTEDGIPYRHKFYTVNDVRFDPSDPQKSRLASSGNDRFVRIWDLNALRHEDDPELGASETCMCMRDHEGNLPSHQCITSSEPMKKCEPLDMAYKPDSSMLAVACSDGSLVIYPDASESLDRSYELIIAPRRRSQSTGSILWGQEGTSNVLFASTETKDRDGGVLEGRHVAVTCDGSTYRTADFDVNESGDTMAIRPDGKTFALLTETPTGHRLRLYDVHTKSYRNPTHQIDLEPFTTEQSDITFAAFSPIDGYFLAVARSDESVHVYDSRYLGRGPLGVFVHGGEARNVSEQDRFGIAEVRWVEAYPGGGGRPGLVTGGTDGCVRLWDISKASNAPDNGTVIAEIDYNVSHFSIGEVGRDEVPLVVGDYGGQIKFFDRTRRL